MRGKKHQKQHNLESMILKFKIKSTLIIPNTLKVFNQIYTNIFISSGYTLFLLKNIHAIKYSTINKYLQHMKAQRIHPR